MTSPLLLPEWRPSEQSHGAGATNRWIKRAGRGRGVICQATPRPRRTSDSRGYTVLGSCQPWHSHSWRKSGKLRLGRGGGVTSRSCPFGAKTRQSGSSGDALRWPWWKNCGGAGQTVELGAAHRLSDRDPETSPHSKQSVGGSRIDWTPGSQGTIGYWWRKPCARARNMSPPPAEDHRDKTYYILVL